MFLSISGIQKEKDSFEAMQSFACAILLHEYVEKTLYPTYKDHPEFNSTWVQKQSISDLLARVSMRVLGYGSSDMYDLLYGFAEYAPQEMTDACRSIVDTEMLDRCIRIVDLLLLPTDVKIVETSHTIDT